MDDGPHDAGQKKGVIVKRLLATCLLVTLAGAATPALAQVHGIFTDGKVVPVNGHLGGGYLQFDQSSAALMGQLRLSFYQNLDFGFLGGLARVDVNDNTQTTVRLEGDFRGQIFKQSSNFPVDMTLGAALGVETADDFTILSVGPTAVASRTLDVRSQWVAYGGASILISRISHSNSSSTTDTSLPLRAGLEFLPNPDLRLLTEAQWGISDEINDDFRFTFGVLFPF